MSSAFHIHIGGARVMIGDMLWKLYEKEYNEATQNNYIYEEVDGNHYPLALFFDTDDRMIHEVQRNKTVKYKKHSFVHGKEDALTFARGVYTVGSDISYEALDSIRKQIETMNRLDEFVITSSISGGTGSGCLCKLSFLLEMEFESKVKQNGFIIFPSSEMSNTVVGVYNAVFSNSIMTQRFNSITMFDNQSMYNAIDYQLQIEIVDYQHLNNLVAQVISSYTGIRRFNNFDNSKMHHLIPSYGKMTLINDYTRTELQQQQFIQYLTKKECQLYQSLLNPRHISTALLFRQKQLNPLYGQFDVTLNNLDLCFGQRSHIFQCASSNYQVLPELAQMKQTGSFFSNDASITSRFKQLRESFSSLRRRTAFHQWYIRENMEDGEFSRALYDIESLEKEYNEVISQNNQQILNEKNDDDL
ncbi:unnamed protein product [Paramecium octaurelia]|uniref:Tubulin/FtsZ GTPase domain-containing protein n=1 Tax=Paramecium octaurelia TaxID=43137 RepID=A0A8S1YKY1_PAROT|nr:unnamed protein product [Paramecium octaurelia]